MDDAYLQNIDPFEFCDTDGGKVEMNKTGADQRRDVMMYKEGEMD